MNISLSLNGNQFSAEWAESEAIVAVDVIRMWLSAQQTDQREEVAALAQAVRTAANVLRNTVNSRKGA